MSHFGSHSEASYLMTVGKNLCLTDAGVVQDHAPQSEAAGESTPGRRSPRGEP